MSTSITIFSVGIGIMIQMIGLIYRLGVISADLKRIADAKEKSQS